MKTGLVLEGGCTDSIPVKAFQKMGYQRNVVVLTRDAAYRKEPEMSLLPKLVYRKYPEFADALLNRHTAYNQAVAEIVEMEQAGDVFVIRPSVELNIGRLEKDSENIQRVYDIGRSDALNHINKLINWLTNEAPQITT